MAADVTTMSRSCRQWYRVQRNRVLGCVFRPTLWALAITVALFPALQASHASVFDFDIVEMAKLTNSAGFFRDFFYITIVIAILAISNMVDSVLRTHGNIGDFSKVCFLLLGAYFIVVLIFGTSHFIDIATVHEALNEQAFNHDYNIIRTTMLAGLFTEIIIALREPAALSAVEALTGVDAAASLTPGA
ncbi:hypothetical protein ACQR2B_31050 [Bradyrhizobium oligotrophicum]|uniref:hypothetical protein n=1 Tax=Bradyrhizobium TaxID=374 RepID=UPI003EB6A6D1